MWKLRTKIVPVIIGTLETIKKGLDQKLLLLPGYAVSLRVSKRGTVTEKYFIVYQDRKQESCKVLCCNLI
jgi:hypothetical protein